MKKIKTIGRRKTSIARIGIAAGLGIIKVNKKPLQTYFQVEMLQKIIKKPLLLIDAIEKYDIQVNVHGGGLKGQAEAIQLAIARALCEENETNRAIFKPYKLLTRDPRMVERKKYGQKKARKKFQFSKR